MDAGSIAIIIATFTGPIAAVQIQKWLDRGREKKNRRIFVFRTLMITRVTMLTDEHVRALNSVPIEFYGERPITDSWSKYIAHLNTPMPLEQWVPKRDDLFTDLLQKMAVLLKYKFDITQLKQESYVPTGHATTENEHERIRKGLVELLDGKISIPMDVRSIKMDTEALERQKELQQLLKEWLSGERAPEVKIGSHASTGRLPPY